MTADHQIWDIVTDKFSNGADSTQDSTMVNTGVWIATILCSGGCTFVDAASGHIDMQFQSCLTSKETMQTVKQHEAKAHNKGMIAQECQSDNGTAFTSQAFWQHPLDKDVKHQGLLELEVIIRMDMPNKVSERSCPWHKLWCYTQLHIGQTLQTQPCGQCQSILLCVSATTHQTGKLD